MYKDKILTPKLSFNKMASNSEVKKQNKSAGLFFERK